MGHGLDPAIHTAGSGERVPGAGGDALIIRLETHDDDPATGPTIERLIEIAGRHGVVLSS